MNEDIGNFRNKLPEWAKVKKGKFLLLRNKMLRNLYYGRYNFVLKLIVSNVNQDLISSKKVLDVGCGVGNFLDDLSSLGFVTYGIDYSRLAIKKISKEHEVVRGYVPPIPFLDSTFDMVVALGLTEHLPDEKFFLEEVVRVLKHNGVYICSIPVEVGIAGLTRHITKYFIYGDTPSCTSIFARARSIFDYSLEELKGECPRQKHGLGHKYYNYKYLINDLKGFFSTLILYYWPSFFRPRARAGMARNMLAPFIFARCVKL